jgi:hypothetical protein
MNISALVPIFKMQKVYYPAVISHLTVWSHDILAPWDSLTTFARPVGTLAYQVASSCSVK